MNGKGSDFGFPYCSQRRETVEESRIVMLFNGMGCIHDINEAHVLQ